MWHPKTKYLHLFMFPTGYFPWRQSILLHSNPRVNTTVLGAARNSGTIMLWVNMTHACIQITLKKNICIAFYCTELDGVPSPCWVIITNLFSYVSISSHMTTSADPLYSYYQKHSFQGILLQLNQSREPKGLQGNQQLVYRRFSSVWWMICSLLQEFVQCQSVKAAPKPTVIHFGKEPDSDKFIAFLRNRVKMPGSRSGIPVSFLWHCIDVIIAAFSGKLVRWPFLSCFFKTLHRTWMTGVLCHFRP